jgi:predicted nucleotidyltransferase
MKTSLDHLPAGKRKELDLVVSVLREGFAEALSRRTMPRFRNGKLLKIILFGSFARGDWVEDPKGRYFSDFDILVVVNHEDLTDLEKFWGGPDEILLKELASGERLRTQPNFIVHSLDDVNEQLRLGRYFFTDILRDGITLFEEGGFPFAERPQRNQNLLRRMVSRLSHIPSRCQVLSEGRQPEGSCLLASPGRREGLPRADPGPDALQRQDPSAEPAARQSRVPG